MKRILTWSTLEAYGNNWRIGPTYYIEADYSPVAVRINAEVAPSVMDAEFNIYDDGVSILADRVPTLITPLTAGGEKYTRGLPETTVILSKGDTEETDAEDFKAGLVIEMGSWISCNCIRDGGGKNFSVHLELERTSEDDEPVE